MKKMKKILALLIAMVMALAMSVTAFAATIEVKGVIEGETYTAYKILNYTANADKTAVSYYLTAAQYDANADGTAKDGGLGDILQDAGFTFTKSADGTQYFVSNANALKTSGVSDVAVALAKDTRLPEKALDTKTATGSADKKAEFEGLTAGYYFVTSSAGSLCALHDDADIATVVEKNTVTTPDKKQGLEDGTYADDQLDVNIGDTVYYDAEIKIGKGANYEITATDTLSKGLTLNHDDGDITVEVDGKAVPAANYDLTATDSGFEITFTANYIATLAENTVIMIEYSAVVNKDAVIATAIPNTFKIIYSNQHFEDHTDIKTYDVNLKKTDGTNALAGAKFNLFTSETGGTALTFSKDNTGYYRDAEGTAEIDAGDGTGVNIRGLQPGTYWFEETVAPDGYNKLDKRTSVVVTKDQNATAEVTVINKQGSVLPSTGGIGTTIFYIIGAILVIGAGVVLVTRRRMNAQ